jgi:hypothetical protein
MKKKRIAVIRLLIITLAAGIAFLSAGPVYAGLATLYVSTTGTDAGNCQSPATACLTVAYAVSQAPDNSFINIAAGTYTAKLTFSKNLTFYGAGMNTTILDGGSTDPVISSSSITTITDMTIQNGLHAGSGGGGIESTAGSLTLTRVKVTGNSANYGGGIYSSGALTMNDCVVSANIANGSSGGGIHLSGTSVTVNLTNVTISGNTATGYSGGIHNQITTGTLNLANVTISGNTANINGALTNTSTATTNIKNSTIAGNHYSAGGGNGGICNYVSTKINIQNTIIAGNDASNCVVSGTGSIVSQGNNLDSGSTCVFTQAGDLQNTDPLLGSLGDNGGPTQTMALLTGSPAIDAGDAATCAASPVNNLDQRGVTRPQGAVCDIGAFEYVCTNDPANIGTSYYGSIDLAYSIASTVETIKLREYVFNEVLNLNLAKIITLKGGYDCDYVTNVGTYSTISGSLTIGGSAGTVKVENVKIK